MAILIRKVDEHGDEASNLGIAYFQRKPERMISKAAHMLWEELCWIDDWQRHTFQNYVTSSRTELATQIL